MRDVRGEADAFSASNTYTPMSTLNFHQECVIASEELAEIKRLLREFKRAKKEAIESGKLEGVQLLGRKIEDRVQALEAKLPCSLSFAETLLGSENVIGPGKIAQCFGVRLEKAPPIPFSRMDLLRAQELGLMLVLQIDTDADGNPLTISRMKTIRNNTTLAGFPLLHEFGKQHYFSNDFYIKEVPLPGWKLVSWDILPETTQKNYIDQTQVIVDYYRETFFAGRVIPPLYQAAIDEFSYKKKTIEMMMVSGRLINRDIGRQETQRLEVTHRMREKAVDIVYRLAFGMQKGDVVPLHLTRSWSSSIDADGMFVCVGDPDFQGAGMSSRYMDINVVHDIGCTFAMMRAPEAQ